MRLLLCPISSLRDALKKMFLLCQVFLVGSSSYSHELLLTSMAVFISLAYLFTKKSYSPLSNCRLPLKPSSSMNWALRKAMFWQLVAHALPFCALLSLLLAIKACSNLQDLRVFLSRDV